MRSKTEEKKPLKCAYPIGIKLIRIVKPLYRYPNDIKRKTILVQLWFVLKSKMKEMSTLSKIESNFLDLRFYDQVGFSLGFYGHCKFNEIEAHKCS